MKIPVIETARLRLRAHTPADLPACAAMWADEGVTRYIGIKPSTLQETWSRMLRYAGLWAFLGYGYWAIEELASREFIGELGFADFKRDGLAALEGVPELGWALASHAHGKGYATEAVGAVLGWADVHLQAPRTVCLISAENGRSIRVAEKSGYRKIDELPYGGTTALIFERPVRRRAARRGALRP